MVTNHIASVVANHIEFLVENQDLTPSYLTLKAVALLAFNKIIKVDGPHQSGYTFQFSPEGVTFYSARLAKQSRQTKPESCSEICHMTR